MPQESSFMMVNPFDLVIDLPVDDSHVNEIAQSLQSHGKMLEPVQVWLKDMRISNGFHRTAAAQRLEWTEIPCMVNDWTEDEFWDARIIAAKPHRTVENERIARWCFESWKQSFGDDILSPQDVESVFRKFGISPNDDDLTTEKLLIYTVMESVYSANFSEHVEDGQKEIIVLDAIGRKRRKYETVWAQRHLTLTEQWFKDKAERWGISAMDIRDKLLAAVGLQYANAYLPTKSFLATVAAARQAKSGLRYFDDGNEHYSDWVHDVDSEKIDGVSYDEYFARIEAERREKERIEREEQQLRFSRNQQYLATPQGQAEQKKRRIESATNDMNRWLDESLERIKWAVRSSSDVPDSAAMFAQFAESVNAEIGNVSIKADALASYNAKLRKENAELRRRIESLERALASKQVASGRLADVVAVSPPN